jgi:class 3 adenylate cyclase
VTEERRLVSVLFADVTGSTALGEELDPEDLRALLGRFFGIAREVVANHGGTIEKFIGDAVMAVFGLPVAHGDDASRALSAALELRDRVRDEPRLGERLPIRLGVNSGEVVATRDAASGGDFLITGDAVNVAARLQQTAAPWQVLAGERTARAADGFAFGPPLALEAKGKASPVMAVEVRGRSTARVAPRFALVGRGDDLAQLELVARRTFGERRPFLVSLIAPAGTGKTRLVEEFLDRLPGISPGARVAIAQCLPYGQRLTYWPLRAVLHRLVEATDEDGPDAVRTRILARLRDLGVAEPERMTALLAATVGAGESEVADRAAVFAAWRTFLEASASASPLVILFEDLHWSSESLLDLTEFVTGPRADAPLLMLVLTRPELLDRRPAWGGGRRNHVSLALEPLPDADVAELVGRLLETAAPGILDAVVARAEGNPFFAGELVRGIAERAGADPSPDAIERALATLPDTVQATVLARLDLLPPDERRMLQVGSVFGRSFRPAGVAALDPAFAETSEVAADRLLERDLVRPASGDGLAFRHILIREVAYGTLPRTERARLHAAAARWLEDRAIGQEEAYAELIAVHSREAAALATALELDDAPAIRERAVNWLERASAAAMASAANMEAAAHLRAALELARPDDLDRLHEAIGDTVETGDVAARAYSEALGLARAAGRPKATILRLIGKWAEMQLRFLGSIADRASDEEMDALIAEGAVLLPGVDDEAVRANFLVARAFLPFWHLVQGRRSPPDVLTAAEADAREAITIADRISHQRLRSAARDALGSIASDWGRWRESRELARERLTFGDHVDLTERVDAYGVVVWSSALIGELDEADRVSAEAFSELQPGQAPNWWLHVAAWRAYSLLLRGHWDAALETAERARRLWLEGGRTAAGYALRGFLAACEIARGRGDDAGIERWRAILVAIGEQFVALPGEVPWPAFANEDVDTIARWAAGQPGDRFADVLERGLSLCADRHAPIDVDHLRRLAGNLESGETRILHAQALRLLGVIAADTDELRRAIALFDECAAAPYAARARCELGIITGDGSLFDAGARVLESLGDQAQLDRYARRRRERGA